MEYTKYFKYCLEKQNELNEYIIEKWYTKGLPQHRAIWTEAAEMAESFYWHWWKDLSQEPDHENIRVEMVDIWHFYLSNYIQRFKNIEDISIYFGSRSYYYLEQKELVQNKKDSFSDEKWKEQVLLVIDDFVKDSTDKEKPASIKKILKLLAYIEFDIEELFKIYYGKYSLNIFRQDNGYKKGKLNIEKYVKEKKDKGIVDKYLKEWEPNTEDNVFMMKIIEDMELSDPEIFIEEVKIKLDIKYKESIEKILL